MAEEETYTHLVLILKNDMSIKQHENSTESIYISKQKVSIPEGVEGRDFTVGDLQTALQTNTPTNVVDPPPYILLDVYLNDDLSVAKYKVSSDKFDTGSNDYKPVEFDGTKMYENITILSLPAPPPVPERQAGEEGGMKLNKKPKKKTKKGTYKRQSNKTK